MFWLGDDCCPRCWWCAGNGYGLKRAKFFTRKSGDDESDDELDGASNVAVACGAGRRFAGIWRGDADDIVDGIVCGGCWRSPIAFANAAADRNPAEICDGNWFCQRPRFNGGKFGGGRWYICGNSRSGYGRPNICKCWRAFSSRTADALSLSWVANWANIESGKNRNGERRCCSNSNESIGSLYEMEWKKKWEIDWHLSWLLYADILIKRIWCENHACENELDVVNTVASLWLRNFSKNKKRWLIVCCFGYGETGY